MVQAQYESLGWLTATTVRGAAFPAVTTTVLLTTFVLTENLLDSKISSFTDSTFENVYDATTFNQVLCPV